MSGITGVVRMTKPLMLTILSMSAAVSELERVMHGCVRDVTVRIEFSHVYGFV
jgi:hypothetical protein